MMKHQVSLRLRRYLTADEFRKSLDQLKAYRGRSIGDGLLDWFEQTGLIPPVVRLAWPEPIARRWWYEAHDGVGEMVDEIEPDGPRLDAAEALYGQIGRIGLRGAHYDMEHPFDEPDSAAVEFLQRDGEQSFVRRIDRRYSVANARYPSLKDSSHIRDYYSSWQILAAAEAADMGVFFQLDMSNEQTRRTVHEQLTARQLPAGPYSELFAPPRAMLGFRDHRAALDATIWAAEEGAIAFLRVARGHGGGRIRLSEDENRNYHSQRIIAARVAMTRYGVSADSVIALCVFLGERWSEWMSEGRPLIADAYKIHLAAAVRMVQLAENMPFDEIDARVGGAGTFHPSILREIWPDWLAEQREALVDTLRASAGEDSLLSGPEIDAFAAFLEAERQDAVFLRLDSFTSQAFDGEAPSPIIGMASDLQGMAVAVEHAVRAMGGTGDQLYDMFSKLWANTPVARHLKRHARLARQGSRMNDWPALKASIAAVAAIDDAGRIAADLIMAHRLRGAVHIPIPEDDQLELERLFVVLIRAMAMTHAHLGRIAVQIPSTLPGASNDDSSDVSPGHDAI